MISLLKEHKELSSILFVLFILLIWNINMPYVGLHESCNLWYGQISKNYQIKGFWQSKFAPHLFLNPDQVYLHHPILLSLLVGISNFVLGFGDWVSRSIPVTFALLSIVVQYLLVKDVWDKQTAILSCFFASFFPMTVLFGKLVNYEPVVLFFSLFSLYCYHSVLTRGKGRGGAGALVIALVLAMLTDWPGYIMAGLLACHSLFVGRNKKLAIIIICTTAFIFAVQFSYIIVLSGGIDEIFGIFLKRLGVAEVAKSGEAISLHKWFVVILLRIFVYFNPTLYLIVPFFLFHLFKKPHGTNPIQNFIILILFLYAFGYAFIFMDGSYQHNFWIYHFIPSLAIIAALGFKKLRRVKMLQYGVIASYVLFSLAVIFTLKSYEKDNLELYALMSDVVSENDLANPNGLPVVFTRQFESMLLPYYFDINVREISNMKEIEELTGDNSQKTIMVITNTFSNTKTINEIKRYLSDRFFSTKKVGQRFSIYLYDLTQDAIVEPKVIKQNIAPKKENKKKSFINSLVIPTYTGLINYLDIPEI